MVDFSNIAALDVDEKTEAEYTFDLVPGLPSIFFSPAHDSNPRFLDERLRLSVERAEKLVRAPRGKRPAKQTPDDLKRQLEEDREQDRVLLARTCALRWGTPPKDVNGAEPEFSPDNCYAFLKALPNYMLDPLRNWAANIYNFVNDPAVSEEEAGQLGN